MAVGGLARLQPQRRAVPEHSQRDGGDHGAADAALLHWSLEAWNHNRACSGQRGLNRSVSDHGRLPDAEIQQPGLVMNKVPDCCILCASSDSIAARRH